MAYVMERLPALLKRQIQLNIAMLRISLVLALLVCSIISTPSWAAGPKSETIYPKSTVGFISIQNMVDCRARWNRTQLGMLCDDPEMKPFMDQLHDKIADKLGDTKDRLGITLEELGDVATGEVTSGLIPATAEDGKATIAMMADITGKQAEAQELLDEVKAKLVEKKNAVLDEELSSETVTVYQVPKSKKRRAYTAAYFLTTTRIGIADNADVLNLLHDRLKKPAKDDSISQAKNYVATLKKSREAAGNIAPTIVWYLDPFALDTAVKTRKTPKELEDDANSKQTMKTLREEGFNAVKGIGGLVQIAPTKQKDFVHYTTLYAPPKEGTEGKPAAERYTGSMRMLEMKNSEAGSGELDVQPWAPREIASYKTVNLDLLNAFDHMASLFDAVVGYENAFQTTLNDFEVDPFGPKINLRDDIVVNLGQRITILTDYTLPVSAKCERYLIVIDDCNVEKLQEPLDKLMTSDGAIKKKIEGIEYWETVPEETEDIEADLMMMGDDLMMGDEEEVVNDSKSAVCLHEGRLILTSDVEFLRKALFGIEDTNALADSRDMIFTMDATNKLARGKRSSWAFTRMDEALRPSYELIRAGQMPESKTFFGRILNRLLTTDEQEEAGETREQKIDGTKLPSFEMVRRYFGPSARVMRTDDDGWVLIGVVMNKAAE